MSELREQAELQRLFADAAKLQQEANELVAEAHKLEAERRELDKELWWFPWLQLLTLVVLGAAIGAVVARLIH